MNGLLVVSIISLVLGVLLFISGLLLYQYSDIDGAVMSIYLMFAIVFLILAIILIIIKVYRDSEKIIVSS